MTRKTEREREKISRANRSGYLAPGVLLLAMAFALNAWKRGGSGLLCDIKTSIAVRVAGAPANTRPSAATAALPRFPWRFAFESPERLNQKRLEAIAELKKFLENPKPDGRNADDDCNLLYNQNGFPGSGCMYRHLRKFVNLDFLQQQGTMKLGQEVKTMADPRLFGSSCSAFCAGINKDSTFEQMLSSYCSNVHAFDCTVSPDKDHVKNQKFKFHQICLGKTDSVGKDTVYLNDKDRQVSRDSVTFESVATMTQRLNISTIDIMKFDIEGGEWALLENILALPSEIQPVQIMFELHAEGAHWRVVPRELVKGKRQREIDQLFLRLYEAGYGLMDITVNPADHICAEISVLKITDHP